MMNTSDPLLAPLDWQLALVQAQALPAPERLLALLNAAGCVASPLAPRLIVRPAVRLWCLGGLPVHTLLANGMSTESLVRATQDTMGIAGSQSYLAMPGKSAQSAYRKIVGELGHASVAHTVQVSLVVAGVSCAVENEFNSQRDLVHLARVTEARTDAQQTPPLVVLEPALAPFVEQALHAIDAIAKRARSAAVHLAPPLSKADTNEAINGLFPAAKATLFVLTGSLRNLQKLLGAEGDPGKEKEYRRALGLIRHQLQGWWPELFLQEPNQGETT